MTNKLRKAKKKRKVLNLLAKWSRKANANCDCFGLKLTVQFGHFSFVLFTYQCWLTKKANKQTIKNIK